MVRVQVIPRIRDSLDYESWLNALDVVIPIVVNHLLGNNRIFINIPSDPRTVKRMLKMLKLLGFKVEIRRRKGCYYYQYLVIVREVKEPKDGLKYLIQFAPIIEVKVWLDFLLKLLTRQKAVIPPSDTSVLRRFTDWWMAILELQEKGLIRIERKLIYCDDEMQECEYDYTIYIYP